MRVWNRQVLAASRAFLALKIKFTTQLRKCVKQYLPELDPFMQCLMLRSVPLAPTLMPLQLRTPILLTVLNVLRVTLVAVNRLLRQRQPALVVSGATLRMK